MTPTLAELASGWYAPTAPGGNHSTMHRALWSFRFTNPIEPISDGYNSPGGFQLAHTLDVDQVFIALGDEALRAPSLKVGTLFPAVGVMGEALDTHSLARVVFEKRQRLRQCLPSPPARDKLSQKRYPTHYAIQRSEAILPRPRIKDALLHRNWQLDAWQPQPTPCGRPSGSWKARKTVSLTLPPLSPLRKFLDTVI